MESISQHHLTAVLKLPREISGRIFFSVFSIFPLKKMPLWISFWAAYHSSLNISATLAHTPLFWIPLLCVILKYCNIGHCNDFFPFWIWSWVSNSKKLSKDNLLPNGMAWPERHSELTDSFLMSFLYPWIGASWLDQAESRPIFLYSSKPPKGTT